MKLAACVILYNPDQSVVSNIHSYRTYVDVVIAVDNSEVANTKVVESLKDISDVLYLPNGKNLGIATALNIAAERAKQDGFTWLLTMDQDSFFDEGEMDLYLRQFKKLIANNSRIGIVCPSETKHVQEWAITEGAHRITSGSWVNIDVYETVGGFNDRLFIDEVDKDFACKVELSGYRLIGFDNVKMNHKLGVKKNTGLFGLFFRRQRTIHSPFRLYYMVRNYLYIRRMYADKFPAMFAKRDQDFKIMLKNNILYSGSVFKAIYSAMKGYFDYKFNRFN